MSTTNVAEAERPPLFRPGEEWLWRAFFDIAQQASRKRRAADLKRYLETDLEIIEKKADEARAELERRAKEDSDYKEVATQLLARARQAAEDSHTWNWEDYRKVEAATASLLWNAMWRERLVAMLEHQWTAHGNKAFQRTDCSECNAARYFFRNRAKAKARAGEKP